MPAIQNVYALERREWRDTVGQSGMTPTAFAFLVPVFVVIVFCPFVFIFCLRRRRQRASLPPVPRKTKKPALRRAEARERLRQVTDVSNIATSDEGKTGLDGAMEEREQASIIPDSASASERECAICLSTLHAPSPPAPVLLSPPTDEAAIHPPITPEHEPILKLHTCSHTFHAECLVSWFVLRKTTCPICRAPYISKEDMDAYEEEEVAATREPVVEQMAVVEGRENAGQTSSRNGVSNLRYFWAGESVLRRENGADAIRDEERGQNANAGGRGRRFWRRGT